MVCVDRALPDRIEQDFINRSISLATMPESKQDLELQLAFGLAVKLQLAYGENDGETIKIPLPGERLGEGEAWSFYLLYPSYLSWFKYKTE